MDTTTRSLPSWVARSVLRKTKTSNLISLGEVMKSTEFHAVHVLEFDDDEDYVVARIDMDESDYNMYFSLSGTVVLDNDGIDGIMKILGQAKAHLNWKEL
jgi:hypothetical protein